ncbi:MAG: sensor histidine kinase [Bacillota bacterium]
MKMFPEYNQLLNIQRLPISLWIVLVYVGALVLQFFEVVFVMQSIVFTIVMAIHIFIYWFSNLITNRWAYLLIQGSLVILSAFLVPSGSPVILIGLLPTLIAQSISMFQNNLKVLIVFIIFYSLYCVSIGILYGVVELPIFITILFIILTIVIFYSVLYNRQVHARKRMEYYLQEVEKVHRKVEQLTLSNERQRMARDLHDTLAQGVAGLITQLEAAHIQKGNTLRSQEIIESSMNQARETLREARIAIDDLRAQSIEEIDFYDVVLEKIKHFSDVTQIDVVYEIESIPRLSSLIKEHILYILSECLTNISKHSQAQKVGITLKRDKNFLVKIMELDFPQIK